MPETTAISIPSQDWVYGETAFELYTYLILLMVVHMSRVTNTTKPKAGTERGDNQ